MYKRAGLGAHLGECEICGILLPRMNTPMLQPDMKANMALMQLVRNDPDDFLKIRELALELLGDVPYVNEAEADMDGWVKFFEPFTLNRCPKCNQWVCIACKPQREHSLLVEGKCQPTPCMKCESGA
jgi:hypothetical protein